ncbi:hypothetical protein N7519_009399 [Penicillium mononematosum]|uniref:uncharacterized protein n=1 Tax=Penicillium mononematosum TaxID=268346 RepID=UPI002547D4CA|nr:uncharacterized protein N7519_009399 [Penicillium mononematosum]KAJ6178938.1 hypothetical protein N7519_009399 [Penicillium mononematosum]
MDSAAIPLSTSSLFPANNSPSALHRERVTLRFTDGASATGDMLIGADGMHSVVRKILLGRLGLPDPLRILHVDTSHAQLEVSDETFERQLPLSHGVWLVATPSDTSDPGVTLFTGLGQVNPDCRSGIYFWYLSSDRPDFKLPDRKATNISKKELLEMSRKVAQRLQPQFRKIVELTSPEGIAWPPYVTSAVEMDKSSLQPGRVTLLGDAAHGMPPYRGEGGVQAMRDGLKLAQIRDTRATGAALEDLMGAYRDEMLERAVRASIAAGTATNEGRVMDLGPSGRDDSTKEDFPRRHSFENGEFPEEHCSRAYRDAASIGSDDERKWVSKVFEGIEAEEKRRQGLSPAERRQEDIQVSAKALERLVKEDVGPYSSRPYAVFLLQVAPQSRSGAKCQLPHCETRILPGDYRIKLDGGHWSEYPSGSYHVDCFEEILNLSSRSYASRFIPDMQYFPGRMEVCILQEYVRRWMIRLGVQEHPFPEQSWGTFAKEIKSERYFVSETDPEYDERHSLSTALRNWLQRLSEAEENE